MKKALLGVAISLFTIACGSGLDTGTSPSSFVGGTSALTDYGCGVTDINAHLSSPSIVVSRVPTGHTLSVRVTALDGGDVRFGTGEGPDVSVQVPYWDFEYIVYWNVADCSGSMHKYVGSNPAGPADPPAPTPTPTPENPCAGVFNVVQESFQFQDSGSLASAHVVVQVQGAGTWRLVLFSGRVVKDEAHLVTACDGGSQSLSVHEPRHPWKAWSYTLFRDGAVAYTSPVFRQ